MKKLSPSHLSVRLTYTKLYLDELERILDLLKEQSLVIEINDKEFEYESINEVVEKKGERLSQIEIVGKKPDNRWCDITLTIKGRRIMLRANSKLELLWRRVKDFVGTKTTWYARYFDPWVWGWITFGLVTQYQLFLDKEAKQLIVPVWFKSLALFVASIFVISLFNVAINRGVVLARKHSVSSFWSRNADRILMLILGVLIGGFGKYLLKLIGVE